MGQRPRRLHPLRPGPSVLKPWQQSGPMSMGSEHRAATEPQRGWGVETTPFSNIALAGHDYELGRLVFELRVGAGLTQAQLAERMGTTQAAFSRLEEGGGTPRLDTLAKLAEAVGRGFVVSFPGDDDETEPIALTLR